MNETQPTWIPVCPHGWHPKRCASCATAARLALLDDALALLRDVDEWLLEMYRGDNEWQGWDGICEPPGSVRARIRALLDRADTVAE